MRIAFWLGLLLLGCVACEPPVARTSPEDAARAAQRQQEVTARALEEADKERWAQAQKARDEAITRDIARNEEAARAKERAAEVERQRVCLVESDGRKARLAELEPKVTALRAARQEAARSRPEDEAWVRANCRWENDPRYALEVERQRRAGETQFVVNERFAGFGRSVPRCPKSTSARRLQIAAEIANQLVSAQNAGLVTKVTRDLEDEQAGVPEYDVLKAVAIDCGDAPDSALPPEQQPASATKGPTVQPSP